MLAKGQGLQRWRTAGSVKDAEEVLFDLCDHLLFLHAKILRHLRHMTQIAKSEKCFALLRSIPGVGPITASAIVATVGSGKQFIMAESLSLGWD